MGSRFIQLGTILLILEFGNVSTRSAKSRPPLKEVAISLNKPVSENTLNVLYKSRFNWLNQIKDNCRGGMFNQTIRKRGCISIVIPNKLCYGQCGSYFVPNQNSRTFDFNSVFEDCRQCKPESYQVIAVVLRCPFRRRKHRIKKVVLINSCRCRSTQCVV